MINSIKENGWAKVCDQREHQVTLGREARRLGEDVEGCGFLLRIPVTDFCHGFLSGFNRSPIFDILFFNVSWLPLFDQTNSTQPSRPAHAAKKAWMENWKLFRERFNFSFSFSFKLQTNEASLLASSSELKKVLRQKRQDSQLSLTR